MSDSDIETDADDLEGAEPEIPAVDPAEFEALRVRAEGAERKLREIQATFLATMARWGALFGGYGGNDRERGGGNIITLLLTAILAPIAAMVVQMAISRSREFAADATGAQIAGQPYGLAKALEKLDGYSKRLPMEASQATAHMFIVAPFTGSAITNLFSTHPPIAERVKRLLGREV